MFRNGIVIQVKQEGIYQGIEGKNWTFDFDKPNRELEEYYVNNIDISWSDDRYVDCCNDLPYIKKYINELLKNRFDYRILLCETNKRFPVIKEAHLKSTFLGYDYAYAGGSYYSCINNDVVSGRIPEFEAIQLNKNGLFESEEEIVRFIQMRDTLKNTYSSMTFEKGDFIVYKLSEIIELYIGDFDNGYRKND
ncbi:hypothetical protein [Anaerosporobacter sp.]|uniref:hypothetical protein n=1 Tax=Anaerosporobacter sp. TaxID=1872529 RepID=UPI00286F54B5|nr:hypothetical protein [Anaerosporobacter sp.]